MNLILSLSQTFMRPIHAPTQANVAESTATEIIL